MELLYAKIITVLSLLALTLTFGILPYCVVLGQSGCNIVSARRETVIKFFNCFAGGVFLGALFLELIPEGSEEFDKYIEAVGYKSEFPFFNVIIVTGFFLTSIVEYFAHSVLAPRYFLKEIEVHADNQKSQCLHNGNSKNYGTLSETTSLMSPPEQITNGSLHTGAGITKSDQFPTSNENNVAHSTSRADGGGQLTDGLGFISPASDNTHGSTLHIRSFLLLLALSFHSVFDGLALGLQDSTSKVWQIFVAVGLHKCIVAFCLGVDVFMNFSDPKLAAFWMVLFSFVSPIGASIGISLTSTGINEVAQLLSSGILQGLSCGAFVYVTFLEILNSSWKNCSSQRSFLDIIFALIGFTSMVIAKLFD